MSKSTMAERAAEYVAELGARPNDVKWATVICAAFAAREVARVREAQAEGLHAIKNHALFLSCKKCTDYAKGLEVATSEHPGMTMSEARDIPPEQAEETSAPVKREKERTR